MKKKSQNMIRRAGVRQLPRRILAGYLILSMVFPRQAMAVQPVPAGTTNTQVNAAPNGVPVVNIAAPNGSGLSHNQYTSFNVGTTGLVLNNSTTVQQSLLAGIIRENPNLGGQAASIILNEVVAPNPSTLQGYMEVHGQAAQVIVANPYGITCSGCGFINTPRATLTTGVPNLDVNGNLTGFTVKQGQIDVQNYLDAYGISAFDLVARSAKIDGKVYAKNLRLVLGANEFNYQTGAATPIAGVGPVPLYALDSSLLSGMYADRIRLIATEAGVGVRMQGDMAASVDDIFIDSAGKIELANKVSATNNIQISYTGPSGTIGIQTTNANVAAGNDLTLNTGAAAQAFGSGTLYAANNLTVNAGAATSGLTLGGDTLWAGKNLALNTGNATNGLNLGNGTLYAEAGDIAFNVGVDSGSSANGLDLAGATLYAKNNIAMNVGATTNGLTLRDGYVYAETGNLTISAPTLQDTATTWNSLRHAGQDLSVTLGGGGGGGFGINHGQTWDAGNNLSIAAKSISIGQQTVGIAGVSPTVLRAGGNMTLAATTSGGVVIGSEASITANGNMLIDTKGAAFSVPLATQTSGGSMPTGIQAGGALAVHAADTVDVYGTLLAGGNIQLLLDAGVGAQALNVYDAGLISAGGRFWFSNSDMASNQWGNNNAALGRAGNFTIHTGGSVYASTFGIKADTLTLAAQPGVTTKVGLLQGGTGALAAGDTEGDSLIDVNSLQMGAGNVQLYLNTGTQRRTELRIANDFSNFGLLYAWGDADIMAYGNVRNNASGAIAGGVGKTSLYLQAANKTFGNYGLLNGGAGTIGVYQNSTGQSIVNQVGGTITGAQVFLGGFANYGNRYVNGNTIIQYDNYYGNSITNYDTITGGDITIAASTFTNSPQLIPAIAATTSATTRTYDAWSGYGQLATYFGSWSSNIGSPWVDRVTGTVHYTNPDSATQYVYSRYTPQNAGGGYNLGGGGYVYRDFVDSYTVVDTFAGGATPSKMPSIQASGTLDISTTNGTNHGGELIGNTVNIRPFQTIGDMTLGVAPPASTFTNSPIQLTETKYTQTGRTRYTCLAGSLSPGLVTYTCDNQSAAATFVAPFLVTDRLVATYGNAPTDVDLQGWGTSDAILATGFPQFAPYATRAYWSQGGLIKANTFSSSVTNLINMSPVVAATSVALPAGMPNSTAVVPTANNAAPLSNTIASTLPTGSNGLFVVTSTPGSRYLVETNPLYLGLDNPSLGSDYLAQLLGLDPSKTLLRLGDNAYENYLIKQQVQAQTGVSLMHAAYTDKEQLQELYAGATLEAKRLKLTYGTALTAGQVADLKQDMVWMVEQVVQGHKVLVPMVYLTDATRAETIGNGAKILAGTAVIRGDTFVNKNSTVAAKGDLIIKTRGDIVNHSATMSGANVFLTSTKGNIINTSATQREGDDANSRIVVTRQGSIYATNAAVLVADAGSISITGANVTGGNANGDGGVYLKAGDAVNINALVLDAHASGREVQKTSTSLATSSYDQRTQTAYGSSINSGGNLSIVAGKDVNIVGSSVSADGSAGITSEKGNVNVKTVELQNSWSGSSTRSGLFGTSQVAGQPAQGGQDAVSPSASAFGGFESTAAGYSGSSTRNAGSTISAGGNVVVEAKGARNDINIVGSAISSGGVTVLSAGRDVNLLAAKDKQESSSTRDGYRLGTYAEATPDGVYAGFKIAGGSEKNSSSDTTAQVSSIQSGGRILIQAGKTVTTEGSQISSAYAGTDGQAITVVAKNVDNKEVVDTHTEHSEGKSYDVSILAGATTNGMGQSISDLAQGKKGAMLTIGPVEAQGKLTASGETHDSNLTTSTARTTSLNASGGGIAILATGKVTDAGTTYNAGKDVVISAASYKNKATQNTSSSDQSSTNAGVVITGGVNSNSEVTGSLSAQGGRSKDTAQTSDAVAGSITAGGNVLIKTTGDATLQATNITAGKRAVLDVGGNLNLTQANSTSTTTSESQQGGASVSGSGCLDGGCASASVGAYGNTSNSNKSISTGVAGSISGAEGVVLISGGNTTLQGTKLAASGGNVEFQSGGNVDFQGLQSSTVSTGSTDGGGVNLGGSVGMTAKGVNGGGANVGVDFNTSRTNYTSNQTQGGSIEAGGKIIVNAAGNANFVGTQASGTTAEINVKSLTMQSAQSTVVENSTGVSGNISAGGGKNVSGALGEGGGKTSGSSASGGGSIGISVEDHTKNNLSNQNAQLKTTGGTSLNVSGDVKLAGAQIQGGASGKIGGNLSTESVTDQIKQKDTSVSAYVGVSEVKVDKAGKGASDEPPKTKSDKFNEHQGTALNALGNAGGSGISLKVGSSNTDSQTLSQQSGFTGNTSGLVVAGNANLVSATADSSGVKVLGATTTSSVATHSSGSSTNFAAGTTLASALGLDQNKVVQVNGNVFTASGGGSNSPDPEKLQPTTRPRSSAITERPDAANIPQTRPRSNAVTERPTTASTPTLQRSNATRGLPEVDAATPARPRSNAITERPTTESAPTLQRSNATRGLPEVDVATPARPRSNATAESLGGVNSLRSDVINERLDTVLAPEARPRMDSTPGTVTKLPEVDVASQKRSVPTENGNAGVPVRPGSGMSEKPATGDNGVLQELRVLKDTQSDFDRGGPLTSFASGGNESRTNVNNRTAITPPVAEANATPLRKDFISQQVDELSGRASGASATALALSPGMLGKGVSDRIAATNKELGITLQKKVLTQNLSSLGSDSKRQGVKIKIEGMEIDRIGTRLEAEKSYAADIMAKSMSPVAALDGTFRPKVAIMDASVKYISSLSGVQGDLASVQQLRLVRDSDMGELERVSHAKQQLDQQFEQTLQKKRQLDESKLDLEKSRLDQKYLDQSRRKIEDELQHHEAMDRQEVHSLSNRLDEQNVTRQELENKIMKLSHEADVLEEYLSRQGPSGALKEEIARLGEDSARLEKGIAVQNQTIRRALLETAIKTTQAEHSFLIGMMPDAVDPRVLAVEADKVMKTLTGLLGELGGLVVPTPLGGIRPAGTLVNQVNASGIDAN